MKPINVIRSEYSKDEWAAYSYFMKITKGLKGNFTIQGFKETLNNINDKPELQSKHREKLKSIYDSTISAFTNNFIIRENGKLKLNFKSMFSLMHKIANYVLGVKNPKFMALVISAALSLPLGTTLHALRFFPWSSYNGFFSFFNSGLFWSILSSFVLLPVAGVVSLSACGAVDCLASNCFYACRYGCTYCKPGPTREPNALTKLILNGAS